MSLRLGSDGSAAAFEPPKHPTDEVSPAEAAADKSSSGAKVEQCVGKVACEVVSEALPGEVSNISLLTHKLSLGESEFSAGVSKVFQEILKEPSLIDYCLRRGISETSIEDLAVAKYDGDQELAAASIIRQNIDKWSRLEKVFGASLGLTIIQTDRVANEVLRSPAGAIVQPEGSALAFVRSNSKVYVIDAEAFAEGSFKSAHKAMEYFSGNVGIFLQAKESPLMPTKVQKSSESDSQSIFDRLFEEGVTVVSQVEGAPKGFLANIAYEFQSRQITEKGPEGSPAGLVGGKDVKATGEKRTDEGPAANLGTFIYHPSEEVDTGTFIQHSSGEADTGTFIQHPSGEVDTGTFIHHPSEDVDAGTFIRHFPGNVESSQGRVSPEGTSGSVVIHAARGPSVDSDDEALDVPQMADEPAYMKALREGGFRTLGMQPFSQASEEMSESDKWKREIKFHEELALVPHIARLHAVVSAEDNAFPGILQKKYDGDLDRFILNGKVELMRGETTWPAYKTQVLGVLADAAEGFAHLHAKGIIHRDIKEANIMTDGDEGIVADLGTLARVTESKMLASYEGTPIYSAPETTVGKTNFASDVWSFALVVHSALVGPFEESPVAEYLAEKSFGGRNPHLILNALKKLADAEPSSITSIAEDASKKSVAAHRANKALLVARHSEFKAKVDDYFSSGSRLDEYFKRAFSLNPAERPTMEESVVFLRSL